MILIQDLQTIGVKLRLLCGGKKSCNDCINGFYSATGDGWNEPSVYEWECPLQEKELKTLTNAYENVVGEIDENYASVCPFYRKITDAERLSESLS